MPIITGMNRVVQSPANAPNRSKIVDRSYSEGETRVESIVSDKTPPKAEPTKSTGQPTKQPPAQPREIGGPKGPEPTRYNDWEKNGRCVDF